LSPDYRYIDSYFDSTFESLGLVLDILFNPSLINILGLPVDNMVAVSLVLAIWMRYKSESGKSASSFELRNPLQLTTTFSSVSFWQ